jgi:malate/lactate dehydrogenase
MCAQRIAERDYADVVVDDYEELSGSAVVVATTEPDGAAIRDRAPDAVVIVATDSVAATCQQVCETTRFPRERVIGLPDSAAGDAATDSIVEMVEAVLFDRNRELLCVALCLGEGRAEDRFVAVPVRLGRGGIEEFVE